METSKIRSLDERVQIVFERLLKSSPPHRERRHALLKLLSQEEGCLGRADGEAAIKAFYELPYERRTAGQFRRVFGIRSYPWLLDQFNLSFRTAAVSETKIFKAASSLRHMILNSLIAPAELTSVDLLHLVVHRITRPRVDQAAAGIGLRIFSRRWRDVAFFKFGSRHELFFDELDQAIEAARDEEPQSPSAPVSFYRTETESELVADSEVTQTDLNWLKDIVQAFHLGLRPPLYPLRRGPQVPVLLRLERLVRAAHTNYPRRHPALEEAVLRGCKHYLAAYRQDEDHARKTG